MVASVLIVYLKQLKQKFCQLHGLDAVFFSVLLGELFLHAQSANAIGFDFSVERRNQHCSTTHYDPLTRGADFERFAGSSQCARLLQGTGTELEQLLRQGPQISQRVALGDFVRELRKQMAPNARAGMLRELSQVQTKYGAQVCQQVKTGIPSTDICLRGVDVTLRRGNLLNGLPIGVSQRVHVPGANISIPPPAQNELCNGPNPSAEAARQHKIGLLKAIYEVGRLNHILASASSLFHGSISNNQSRTAAARLHALHRDDQIRARIRRLEHDYPDAFTNLNLYENFTAIGRAANTPGRLAAGDPLSTNTIWQSLEVGPDTYWMDPFLVDLDSNRPIDACDPEAHATQGMNAMAAGNRSLGGATSLISAVGYDGLPPCDFARAHLYPRGGALALRDTMNRLSNSQLDALLAPVYRKWRSRIGDTLYAACGLPHPGSDMQQPLDDCALLSVDPQLNQRIFERGGFAANPAWGNLLKQSLCQCPASPFSSVIPFMTSEQSRAVLTATAAGAGAVWGMTGAIPVVGEIAGAITAGAGGLNGFQAWMNNPVHQHIASLQFALGGRAGELGRNEQAIREGNAEIAGAVAAAPGAIGVVSLGTRAARGMSEAQQLRAAASEASAAARAAKAGSDVRAATSAPTQLPRELQQAVTEGRLTTEQAADVARIRTQTDARIARGQQRLNEDRALEERAVAEHNEYIAARNSGRSPEHYEPRFRTVRLQHGTADGGSATDIVRGTRDEVQRVIDSFPEDNRRFFQIAQEENHFVLQTDIAHAPPNILRATLSQGARAIQAYQRIGNGLVEALRSLGIDISHSGPLTEQQMNVIRRALSQVHERWREIYPEKLIGNPAQAKPFSELSAEDQVADLDSLINTMARDGHNTTTLRQFRAREYPNVAAQPPRPDIEISRLRVAVERPNVSGPASQSPSAPPHSAAPINNSTQTPVEPHSITVSNSLASRLIQKNGELDEAFQARPVVQVVMREIEGLPPAEQEAALSHIASIGGKSETEAQLQRWVQEAASGCRVP